MNLHRVRRLAETLVASQIRSGRSTSDPRSWFGRPFSIAVYDLAAFLLGLLGAFAILSSLGLGSGALAVFVGTAAPVLPLVAVGAVLLVGVLFELTATAKFSGSDAANWLPITPAEYVVASAAAIAYSYSPPIFVLLGALLPFALGGGVLPLYALVAILSVVALFEGAVLVEMVRAASQGGSGSTGRRGQLSMVVRAALLVVLLLVFDLAFNPVFLLAWLQGFQSFEVVAAAIPFFWSTEALSQWVAGNDALGLAFTAAQLAFVGLLAYVAARLRVRFWVPSPTEAESGRPVAPGGHRLLRGLGLSAPEAALASKDLWGYVRRREMMPTLVVPVVLVLLLLLEGASFGPIGAFVWAGWVAGFFPLLLAARSLGQERRSLQWLYAFPISVRSIVRAKAASVLVPAVVGTVLVTAVISTVQGVPVLPALGVLVVMLAVTVVLGFWGLAFAARYSDFQDRPRPQFIRPAPMFAAMGSGMVLLFGILVPGTLAVLSPSADSIGLAAFAAGFALCAGAAAVYWTRTGFEGLFRELPF